MKSIIKTKRKTELISKRKLLSMVLLFEKLIDEKIEVINISSSIIKTESGKDYRVDISKNTVDRSYPDPDWN